MTTNDKPSKNALSEPYCKTDVSRSGNFKLTFDFDGTLTRPEVQDYFLELIERGFDCWVLTSRYDDLHKHRYPKNPTNEDLWELIDKLNFPRYKVKFMNMESKGIYLSFTDVLWHLDDDDEDLLDIFEEAQTRQIDVKTNRWKERCELYISANCKTGDLFQ